ncbi:MAG: hypothetical protein U0795_08460 [Pirellulales bacterium]
MRRAMFGFTLALLTLAAVASLGGQAQAQMPGIMDPGFAMGGWGGAGFNWRQPYYTTSPYSVPYYALHPPVYLSHPVPRTFGYSPFAYPGFYRTPEVVEAEPEMIENPHVEQPAENKPTSHKTAAAPLEVLNPYVDSAPAETGVRITAK